MAERPSYNVKNWMRIWLLLFIVVLIIVVIYLSTPRKMSIPRDRYLNTNSTLAPETGKLNPSDLGYPESRGLKASKDRVYAKIKKFLDLPPTAKIILTSGSTEGIATMVNWAMRYNRDGVVVGTRHDHSSIKDNVEARGMTYLELPHTLKGLPGNVSAIFWTHADAKTGEVIHMPSVHNIQHLYSDYDSLTERPLTTSYPPLIFADVTQSIGKIPVSMTEMGVNGLCFSLHKIGGPQGLGVLVIDEPEWAPFVPLIAGSQNEGLRGGTQDVQSFVEYSDIYRLTEFSPESRKKRWNSAYKKLKDAKLTVQKPQGEHLYNTLLVDIPESCPLGAIDHLASKGIYVGTTSACLNEKKEKTISKIRISFIDPAELDEESLDEIISTLTYSKS